MKYNGLVGDIPVYIIDVSELIRLLGIFYTRREVRMELSAGLVTVDAPFDSTSKT